MATLLKWEAGIIFAVCVLPWLFPVAAGPIVEMVHCRLARGYRPGLCASTIWRATLPIHNDFFGSVEVAQLLTSAHQFAGLASTAVAASPAQSM
jgi:hypothetical protein